MSASQPMRSATPKLLFHKAPFPQSFSATLKNTWSITPSRSIHRTFSYSILLHHSILCDGRCSRSCGSGLRSSAKLLSTIAIIGQQSSSQVESAFPPKPESCAAPQSVTMGASRPAEDNMAEQKDASKRTMRLALHSYNTTWDTYSTIPKPPNATAAVNC